VRRIGFLRQGQPALNLARLARVEGSVSSTSTNRSQHESETNQVGAYERHRITSPLLVLDDGPHRTQRSTTYQLTGLSGLITTRITTMWGMIFAIFLLVMSSLVSP